MSDTELIQYFISKITWKCVVIKKMETQRLALYQGSPKEKIKKKSFECNDNQPDRSDKNWTINERDSGHKKYKRHANRPLS